MKLLEKHPIIMIIIGIIGISLSSIFVKYSDASSAVTASFRLLWSVLFLTPVVISKKAVRFEIKSFSKKNLFLSCLSGIFLAVHFVLWFESLKHTSVASSTTIVCTEVIFVSIGFCVLLKGRLSKSSILAIAVTFIGSVIIALSGSSSGASLYGDVLALLSAIAVAIYTLIGRIVRKDASTTAYTYIVYLICAIVLVLITFIQGDSLANCGKYAIIVGFLLALFSTILGHSIFSWCLKYYTPSFVSASKLCEPVVAGVLAALLFNELPSVLQILGAITVLGGVLYFSILENKQIEK